MEKFSALSCVGIFSQSMASKIQHVRQLRFFCDICRVFHKNGIYDWSTVTKMNEFAATQLFVDICSSLQEKKVENLRSVHMI